MEYTSILINIRKIVRAINLESKKIEKEYGVSIPQLLCLSYLSTQADFRASHRQIALYLNLNSSTVTGIIHRLEARGLVARLPHQSDKRVILISLTAGGATLLKKSPQLLHERLSRKLQNLPEDSLSEIDHTLNILIKALEIENIQASPLITSEDAIAQPED